MVVSQLLFRFLNAMKEKKKNKVLSIALKYLTKEIFVQSHRRKIHEFTYFHNILPYYLKSKKQ
jgi:hypothetical protein